MIKMMGLITEKTYTKQDLLKYLKSTKHGILINAKANGRSMELAINNSNLLKDDRVGFGLTKDGTEVEFKYTDVKSINIDGKIV